MADDDRVGRFERLTFPANTSLTARILAVNLIPLMLLAGSLFFLDSYRRQLLSERYNLARIEAQIRTSMLDLETASQLVAVARSNADLTQQELSDARERFTAGVTDNLEVVDAGAAVVGSQAQLVSAIYQFNVAKVNLARSTGVLQSKYRALLGM